MGYKVIIIEDNKTDAKLMNEHLKRSQKTFSDIRVAYEKSAYEKLLKEFQADIIIADYRLIGFNGLEAIRLRDEYQKGTPVVIVSATIGEENAVQLIKAGAADFLIKNNITTRLAQVAVRAIEEAMEKQSRRAAEVSLAKTRSRYQMLFNTSLDGILIGLPNRNGDILDANPAICDMLGYSLQKLKQLNRRDLFVEKNGSMKAFMEARDREGEFRGEIILKHRNGKHIPIDCTSLIVGDNSNKKSFTILRDITAQKRAKKKLAWQHNVQMLHKDVSLILNENISFEDALKKSIECIIDFLGWDLGHLFLRKREDDSDFYISTQLWVNHAEGQASDFIKNSSELTFLPKEGFVGKAASLQEPIWLQKSDSFEKYVRFNSLNSSPIKAGILVPVVINSQSEAILEFYTSADVEKTKEIEELLTSVSRQMARLFERKQNMDRLENEKERFRLLAQNSTDMISRHDAGGNYLYASPSSKKLTGYTPDELEGNSLFEYIHPDDIDRISQVYNNLLKSPGQTIENYRLKRKNNELCWVESTYRSIPGPKTNEIIEFQCATRDISDRKKFEQELQEQLSLNEQIINSLPGIFFILSKDGQVVRFNDKFTELLDFKPGEDHHYLDYVAEDDKDKGRIAFERTFKLGAAEVEVDLQLKNGQSAPFIITGVIDTLSDNEYLIGTGTNISERIQIEKELKSEKKFTDRAINSLPGLFYVLDEDQNYVRFNQNLVDHLGYSREEIDQMEPLDFYLEKDHERIVQVIEKVYEEGSASIVSRLKTKSGELPYYYITGSHFTQDGKNYILGTGVNITKQKNLETLLNQAQKMARIGGWEVDFIKNEIRWTEVTRQIHEVGPDFEPDIENIFEFYKEGENKDALISESTIAVEKGIPYDLEVEIETAKGNTRWVRIIADTEFRDGECNRIFGSIQDIHDKKVAEEILKRSLKEKEVLLMEIHHRVKNNMAIISGLMQLQAQNTDNETVYGHLNASQSRIQSIALIHEQLYQNNNFSVINLKDNIMKLTDYTINSKKNDRDIELHLNLENISVNINQAVPFSLILNELLTNAYSHAFTGQSSGEIFINLEKESDTVQLVVKDNGLGLPDNFNLDDPDTLGATLLNILSQQMKGELDFQSNGNGSTFTLTFEKLDDLRGSSSGFLR